MGIELNNSHIISAGTGCLTEFQLRDHFKANKNCRTQSLPLDWCLTTINGSLEYISTVLTRPIENLSYELCFDRGMPEFKDRGNVFHWHMPKMLKITGSTEQQHKALKKNLRSHEKEITERFQNLDYRLKKILLNDAKQVNLLLNCCQKNHAESMRTFTTLNPDQCMDLNTKSIEALELLSKRNIKTNFIFPNTKCFRTISEKIPSDNIIWIENFESCAPNEIYAEQNYKGKPGELAELLISRAAPPLPELLKFK